ncbi:MAG: hypothetical protein COA97_06870, partial [Flavobacteriales bacterium]
MAQMSDDDFLTQVNMAETDAISHSSTYMPLNRRMLSDYLGCPNGYEVEGQSQVVSTEVSDVVGSDMPSLVRFFLGGREIMKFKPNSENERDVTEANEKTKYVHHIIRNQKNSFKIFHDFLKSVEIQTAGILHYPWKEQKTTQVRDYRGLDESEMIDIVRDIEIEAAKQKFEVEITEKKENPDDTFDLKLKITRTKKGVVIENIDIEQLLISRNAKSKDDADLFGHSFMARRGDLLAQDFDKDKLKAIPVSASQVDESMRQIRFGTGGQT